MKSVYKVLAYVIAAEVAIQAAAIAFAIAGLGIWVEQGGTFDAAAFEDENLSFTGILGFVVHGINGTMVIPVLALVLLIVSFFTKTRGAIRNAAIVLVLVVLQVALGVFGHESAYIGLLHGFNALLLFSAALHTGMAASKAQATTVQQSEAATV